MTRGRQFRIKTDHSDHRCDVLLLINGVPVARIELNYLSTNTRPAIEQIVEYNNQLGKGYVCSLLCFVQLFNVRFRRSGDRLARLCIS